MALPKDHRNDEDGPVDIDSASGVWKRSPPPSPSRTLHDARNLVFALKATLVWLDELATTQGAGVEIREGIEDLSAVSDRLNDLLTEALSTGASSDRRATHR
jgi:hypothetical protein